MSYAFRLTAATLVVVALAACGDGPTPPRTDPGTASAEADALLASVSEAGVATVYATVGPPTPLGLSSAPCTYADGRYTCPAVTHADFTVTRTFAFYDASGAPQRHYDPLTTASVFNSVAIKGTTAREGSTIEMERAFNQTVSGLLGQETRRVIDGTGTGSTRSTITTANGTYTATTVAHDTTRALVLPVVHRPADPATAGPVYPLGGSVTSVMSLSLSGAGAPNLPGAFPRTTRMVTTFDGTSVARIEITVGGVTRSCTLDMAARPSAPSCATGGLLGP